MANNEKNKLWTVVKILLAVAAIGVAAYAIYRKFFQKKAVEELDAVEDDTPVLEDAAEETEAPTEVDGAVETVELPADAVIANAEAMEA